MHFCKKQLHITVALTLFLGSPHATKRHEISKKMTPPPQKSESCDINQKKKFHMKNHSISNVK